MTKFTFGDSISLVHWPGTLSHLQKLLELHISGTIVKYFPSHSLRGFEHTLRKLWIEKTQLRQIPLDIGRMIQLKELYIDHNTAREGNHILVDSVFMNIGDTLEVLSLTYDHLSTFPEQIKFLPLLKNLSLDGNLIAYIDDESVRSVGNGHLVDLSLRNCGMNRIPGALSDLNKLEHLDVSGNNIRTIESLDLVNLPNLLSLSIRGNPLKFVSRSAFHRLPSVEELDLSRTNLTEIPTAIQNLNALRILDLTNSPVDCTCDIFWIKRWFDLYGIRIEIKGQCETIDNLIQEYIEGRITSCPQYKELPFG